MTRGKERALPASLAANDRVGQWLAIRSDGHVILTPGKVEIGQGILSALAQICADELDVELTRVLVLSPSTAYSPNEGVTSGSLSISDSGMSVRHVAAQARGRFLSHAAREFGVDQAELRIQDGTIVGPGNLRTSYWELAERVSLDEPVDPAVLAKPASARSVAGRSIPRIDVAETIFGTRAFIHDLKLEGMLHGRVLKTARPDARLSNFDPAKFGKPLGLVSLVRDGSFLGVICGTERDAESALKRLEAASAWEIDTDLPDAGNLAEWLKSSPADSAIVDRHGEDDPPAATDGRELRRSYLKPFLAHASIGPSCAIASWNEGRLSVWSHTQGIYNLRSDLAIVFGIAEDRITVAHVDGAGCYGHNGADDAALDAALLARATPGRPVRVRWSRADELSAGPFGAAMTIDLAATVSPTGDILSWRHELWSNGHVARPGRASVPALASASLLAVPFPKYTASDPPLPSGGSHRNSVPLYDFPSRRIIKHRVEDAPLRTSSMRSLGAFANVFAIESFMDELAGECGMDPLEYRLRFLKERRARTVLRRAAELAGWGENAVELGRGRGIGVARYKGTSAWCAVVAEVDLNHEPRATQLWIAVDVGEAINPDGVINQIEGGAIQACSWALKEEVGFTAAEITTRSWDDYPILRFAEVPEVTVALIDRPDEPPLGAGEAAHGPTAAALANAASAALGIRVRRLPITRDQILRAAELYDG